MVRPEEIAEGIYFLCSDAAAAISGAALPIDAGWLASITYNQHPGWFASGTPSSWGEGVDE